MLNALILAVGIHQMWYSLPLIVVVSLVYAGTRHEYMEPILGHALRFGTWICVFMAAVLGVLVVLSKFA